MTLKSGLEVTGGHSYWYHSKTWVQWFSIFALHSNYGPVLHYSRDKARYWWKIVIFHTLFHSTPLLGGLRRNIAIPFGTNKLWWDYLMVKKLLGYV